MIRSLPILLRLERPEPELLWRLVASLYDTTTMMIEGMVAFAAALLVCGFRTHSPIFFWLFLPLLAVTAARLWDRQRFHCIREKMLATGPHPDCRTPDYWAMRRSVGAVLITVLWAVIDVCILAGFDDPFSQMFTLMVQAGWLGGACMISAASPLVAKLQAALPMAATAFGLTLAPDREIKLIIPLTVVHLLSLLKGSRTFAAQRLVAIEAEQKLADANAQLTALSATDGLTGIANRRAFEAGLKASWSRAVRESTEIAAVLLDVDFFKLYNDRYGHLAGDACLRAVVGCFAPAMMRPSDMAARFGGEEFIVLLPNTTEQGAFHVAERICQRVAALALPHEAVPLGVVSVSLGVASMLPNRDDNPQSLISLADKALYEAKSGGRNRAHRSGSSVAEAVPV